MKKYLLLSTTILLVFLFTANGQRRLVTAVAPVFSTNGFNYWRQATTWVDMNNVATVPRDNDSIVIPAGILVTIPFNLHDQEIKITNVIIDVFGTLVIDQPPPPNPNFPGIIQVNNLNITTTTSNPVPVVRLGGSAHLLTNLTANGGTAGIFVIVNGANKQVKYTTENVGVVPTGQQAQAKIDGPAFAKNTAGIQESLYFILGSEAALPVLITGFKATVAEGSVILHWAGQQEINIKSFLVEKSADGNSWKQIGIVQAQTGNAQTAKYTFEDSAATATINYYHLKMIDTDGKITFSNVMMVRLNNTLINVTVFPNPAVNSVNISIGNSLSHQAFTVKLINHNGELIAYKQIAAGTNVLSYDVSNYKAGIYTLEIQFSGGVREVHKMAIVK